MFTKSVFMEKLSAPVSKTVMFLRRSAPFSAEEPNVGDAQKMEKRIGDFKKKTGFA